MECVATRDQCGYNGREGSIKNGTPPSSLRPCRTADPSNLISPVCSFWHQYSVFGDELLPGSSEEKLCWQETKKMQNSLFFSSACLDLKVQSGQFFKRNQRILTSRYIWRPMSYGLSYKDQTQQLWVYFMLSTVKNQKNVPNFPHWTFKSASSWQVGTQLQSLLEKLKMWEEEVIMVSLQTWNRAKTKQAAENGS